MNASPENPLGLSAGELAELVDGELVWGPDDVRVWSVGPVEHGSVGQLGFVADASYLDALEHTRLSAVLLERTLLEKVKVWPPAAVVAASHARWAFAQVAQRLLRQAVPPDRRDAAWVASGALVHPNASVGPFCVIERDARIEEGAVLHPGVHVGAGARIGPRTVLSAHVIVAERCEVGADCFLHPGVVIGSDGFGHALRPGRAAARLPQVGVVLVEDHVEIGAHSCVDRAAFGTTRIGHGTKIDNLVQVGHGADIGPGCVLVAQSGVAGSTVLGRGVIMAAQSGVAGHLEVGEGARILAQAGVMRDVAAGETVLGSPATSRVRFLRGVIRTQQLERWFARVRSLERAWRRSGCR
ncbi:MAG: UDP-3-O-(3-hydroxymyristoyl)glucosamine N-acyltransferase [Myxococcota bacterium]